MVGNGGPRLERVTEDIEAGAGFDGGGHGARVDWVADTERGLEISVSNARLGFLGNKVENGSAGCLAARSSRRRHGNKRTQWLIHGPALAKRSVDKIEKISFGIAEVQVHELCRVHDGATADGEEGIRSVRADPVDGFLDAVENQSHIIFAGKKDLRAVLRLDAHV